MSTKLTPVQKYICFQWQGNCEYGVEVKMCICPFPIKIGLSVKSSLMNDMTVQKYFMFPQ